MLVKFYKHDPHIIATNAILIVTNILLCTVYLNMLYDIGDTNPVSFNSDAFYSFCSALLFFALFVTATFISISNHIKYPLLCGLFTAQLAHLSLGANAMVQLSTIDLPSLISPLLLVSHVLLTLSIVQWAVRAYHHSTTDSLTQLYNQHFVEASFGRLLFLASREASPKIALMVLDLDDFKAINHSRGHTIGDEVLKVVTRLIKEKTRKGDVVARLGGDTFEILIPNRDYESIGVLTERLRSAIENQESTVRVTASIGVAVYEKGDSIKGLRRRATIALYRAKSEGKNRVIIEDQSTILPSKKIDPTPMFKVYTNNP